MIDTKILDTFVNSLPLKEYEGNVLDLDMKEGQEMLHPNNVGYIDVQKFKYILDSISLILPSEKNDWVYEFRRVIKSLRNNTTSGKDLVIPSFSKTILTYVMKILSAYNLKHYGLTSYYKYVNYYRPIIRHRLKISSLNILYHKGRRSRTERRIRFKHSKIFTDEDMEVKRQRKIYESKSIEKTKKYLDTYNHNKIHPTDEDFEIFNTYYVNKKPEEKRKTALRILKKSKWHLNGLTERNTKGLTPKMVYDSIDWDLERKKEIYAEYIAPDLNNDVMSEVLGYII
jgi:hypothetical protein